MEVTPEGVEPRTDLSMLFDFFRHEQDARAAYLPLYSFYGELAKAAQRILDQALSRRGINVHSVQERAKTPDSFCRKASKPAKNDPLKPMYTHPLEQITDLAAVRVIAYFPRTLEEIDAAITQEFLVVEKFDKAENLIEAERFGYQSIHYLVKVNDARCALPEYVRYRDKVVEVQVRTILQHAWAEIEHDIQYKSSATIPRDIKRRFMALAGLLELADREFQAIQDADRDLTQRAVTQITRGELADIEITAASLRSYLDRRLGPDGRMSEFSYDWTARLLLKLGFTSLQQVDLCIGDYSDDHLSRIIDGNRQGQLTRFEYMLLAGMGPGFVERHPWANEPWFGPRRRGILSTLEDHGVALGEFDPLALSIPTG